MREFDIGFIDELNEVEYLKNKDKNRKNQQRVFTANNAVSRRRDAGKQQDDSDSKADFVACFQIISIFDVCFSMFGFCSVIFVSLEH